MHARDRRDEGGIGEHLSLLRVGLGRDGTVERGAGEDMQDPRVLVTDERARQGTGTEADPHVRADQVPRHLDRRGAGERVLHVDRAPQGAGRGAVPSVPAPGEDGRERVAGEGGDLAARCDHVVDEDGEVPVQQPVQALAPGGPGGGQRLTERGEAGQVGEQDDAVEVLGHRQTAVQTG